MKLLTALSLIILSFGSQKSFGFVPDLNGDDAKDGSFKLTCKYEYSSLYHQDKQIRKISMYAQEDKNGVAYFSSQKNSLQAYYFDSSTFPPKPVWHQKGRFDFSATLRGSTLTYNFKFYNYLFSDTIFRTLFDETREIDVSSIHYESQASFKFSSGRLLDQNINNSHWVNKDSVAMVDCVLDAF